MQISAHIADRSSTRKVLAHIRETLMLIMNIILVQKSLVAHMEDQRKSLITKLMESHMANLMDITRNTSSAGNATTVHRSVDSFLDLLPQAAH